MQYEEFIDRVRQRAGFGSSSEAEEATRATLTTLGEYLVGGEGLDLASQFPQGLAEHLSDSRLTGRWSTRSPTFFRRSASARG